MMSLFSSFDLYFFYKNLLGFFFIFLITLSSFFKINFFSSSMTFISNNLSSFFYSLKSKSFNKFNCLIFFSLLLYICFLNFFSVFSFTFPLTSQVSVMLFFSLGIWVSMIFFSLSKVPNKFFYHFIPEGSPLVLSFLLFLIELVSNFIRPLTLMIRLVANILAGHLLMILLSSLVFFFSISYPFYIVLNLVEIFVALIQSYIFSTMLVLYYSEL